jgi:hypothetical protein
MVSFQPSLIGPGVLEDAQRAQDTEFSAQGAKHDPTLRIDSFLGHLQLGTESPQFFHFHVRLRHSASEQRMCQSKKRYPIACLHVFPGRCLLYLVVCVVLFRESAGDLPYTTIDQNEFFREATLRICGDLRLERTLHSTLLYLRKYMPLDLLFAEHLDPDQGAARTICTWHSTA